MVSVPHEEAQLKVFPDDRQGSADFSALRLSPAPISTVLGIGQGDQYRNERSVVKYMDVRRRVFTADEQHDPVPVFFLENGRHA
jgi:hypothetical protein